MSLSAVIQIINALPVVIHTVQSTMKGSGGLSKREEVRSAVISSAGMAQFLGTLKIVDKRKFDKALDNTIDGIVDMLKVCVWK